MSKSLEVGAKAPNFKLPSDGGGSVALKDLAGKTVILYFYPKDLTPGCTQEAADFNRNVAALGKRGVAVLGVSRDSVETHEKFKAKLGLKFPLLSDVEGDICKAYGVWKQKSLYGRKFMGIVRTTFVIDPKGRIAAIYPKVKVTDHVKTVMAELRPVET